MKTIVIVAISILLFISLFFDSNKYSLELRPQLEEYERNRFSDDF
jgi:hypothetical protein